MTDRPICKCHGEPMGSNAGSRSGWRCRIQENARGRARKQKWRKANPDRVRDMNRRRIRAGDTYLALASTVEDAERVNQHVRNRLADFKARQASERKETHGWRNGQAVA